MSEKIWKVGLKNKRQPFRNICGEISTEGPLVIFTRQDDRKMMVSASHITTIEATNLEEINDRIKSRQDHGYYGTIVTEEDLLPGPRSSPRCDHPATENQGGVIMRDLSPEETQRVRRSALDIEVLVLSAKETELKKALEATGMTQASAELIREFMALKDFPGINLDNRDPRIMNDLISAAICSLAALQPDLDLLNGPERCQDPAYLAWKAKVSEACKKVQEALTALVSLGNFS